MGFDGFTLCYAGHGVVVDICMASLHQFIFSSGISATIYEIVVCRSKWQVVDLHKFLRFLMTKFFFTDLQKFKIDNKFSTYQIEACNLYIF